jgi:hypothetical protein
VVWVFAVARSSLEDTLSPEALSALPSLLPLSLPSTIKALAKPSRGLLLLCFQGPDGGMLLGAGASPAAAGVRRIGSDGLQLVHLESSSLSKRARYLTAGWVFSEKMAPNPQDVSEESDLFCSDQVNLAGLHFETGAVLPPHAMVSLRDGVSTSNRDPVCHVSLLTCSSGQ